MVSKNSSKKNFKELSSPYATGGGGFIFESRVVTAFVALMITNGRVPFFPDCSITKIIPQARKIGYDVDDMVVFLEGTRHEEHKILCQIKHTCPITTSSSMLSEVINAAWINYNKSNLFNSATDRIFLITKALCKTDIEGALSVLEDIKNYNSAKEFFIDLNLGKFNSNIKRDKFNVLKKHLIKANKNRNLSDDDIFKFFKCFGILGFDLDYQDSVVSSLLNSHLSQFCQQTNNLWKSLYYLVQNKETHGASITKDDIPEDIKEHFINKPGKEDIRPSEKKGDLKSHQKYHNNSFLKKIILFGSWDENNPYDTQLVSKLTQQKYDVFTEEIKKYALKDELLFQHKYGIWSINNKEKLWNQLKNSFFEEDFSLFIDLIKDVLEEKDPALDLPDNQRCFAPALGKNKKFSNNIRRGIVEGLALLAQTESFTHGDATRIKYKCEKLIQKLLNADWRRWASLQQLISTLAEAFPDQFLSSLKNALKTKTFEMNNIFAPYERHNENYMLEYLFTIEKLAKTPKYHIRCCNVLIELIKIVDDSNLSNTIYNVFSPWKKNNIPLDDQLHYWEVLFKRDSNLAWDLLTKILFEQNKYSNNAKQESILKKYLQLAFNNAKNNRERLIKLLQGYNKYSLSYLNNVCQEIKSYLDKKISAKDKESLWISIVEVIEKINYRKEYLSDYEKKKLSTIKKIEAIASPNEWSIDDLHMFSKATFSEHINESYEKRTKYICTRRANIIRIIYNFHGIEGVLHFAHLVEIPDAVGIALADIDQTKIQDEIFPKMLCSTDKITKCLVDNFIAHKAELSKNWHEGIISETWDIEQKVNFLIKLPFKEDSWVFAKQILKNNENLYWEKVCPPMYSFRKFNLYAAEKFLHVQRPFEALIVLHNIHENNSKVNDFDLCKSSLNLILTNKTEANDNETFYIVELIKYLQKEFIDKYEDLWLIEWQFFQLIEYNSNIRPLNLERKLLNEPDFFCQLIRIIYGAPNEKKDKELTRNEKKIISNAYSLINHSTFVPGMDENGHFSEQKFHNWIDLAKKNSAESGHLNIVLLNIGKKLINAPADGKNAQDLWITRTIAEELDLPDNKPMREGFINGLYNSRGAYIIDPSGTPELKLSEKYFKQADELEEYDFSNFANAMRELAKQYKDNAEEIKSRYKYNFFNS